MKIKLNSEYNEVLIMCTKKKGKVKIIYIDQNTNEIISEQVIDNLEIGKEYDIDLEVPNNYSIKKEKENIEEEKLMSYEDEVLEEMKRLRDAMNE